MSTYDRDTPITPAEYAEVRRFGLASDIELRPPRTPWWQYVVQVLILLGLVVTAPIWVVAIVTYVAYSGRKIR